MSFKQHVYACKIASASCGCWALRYFRSIIGSIENIWRVNNTHGSPLLYSPMCRRGTDESDNSSVLFSLKTGGFAGWQIVSHFGQLSGWPHLLGVSLESTITLCMLFRSSIPCKLPHFPGGTIVLRWGLLSKHFYVLYFSYLLLL